MDDDELLVESFEPAQYWNEAFPLGSGRLGAMVYGGVKSELVQLNEDTIWSGGPTDWNNPKAVESLPVVRELVMEGKYAEATAEATKMLGPDPQVFFFGFSHVKSTADSGTLI
jgi:alpha-L-fucosidase 2